MKKIFGICFSYFAVGFVACICISFFLLNKSVPALLPGKTPVYLFLQSLLLFFRIVPPLLASVFLISLAIYFKSNSEKAQMRFSPVMAGHFKTVMIVSIIFVFIMTLTQQVFTPVVKRQTENLTRAPILLEEYITQGNACLEEENYSLALRYGAQAFKINPENKDAQTIIDSANAVLKAMEPSPLLALENEKNDMVFRAHSETENETVTSLMKKARAAAETGNWLNAHYFSELALAIGDEKDVNFEEAKRLSSHAWNNLQAAPVAMKTKDQELFEKKKDAYRSLSAGDNIDAYYKFLEISYEDAAWSYDPDVKQFLEVARARVESQHFFIDETDRIESFESSSDVYFSANHKDGNFDVVFIRGVTPMAQSGKMVQYLRGFSLYSFDNSGNFVKSIKVPYAKMISYPLESFGKEIQQDFSFEKKDNVPFIMLESIDRNHRGKIISPEYEYSEFISDTEKRTEKYVILPVTTEDFNTILESSSESSMNVNSLLKIAPKADKFGFSKEILGASLIEKITYPLFMMIMLIFFASVAWNFRLKESELFKFIWIFMLPVGTIIVDFLFQAVLAVSELFIYVLIGVTGNAAIFVETGILITALVLVSVFFLCRKSS